MTKNSLPVLKAVLTIALKEFTCQNGIIVVNLFKELCVEGVGKPTPSVLGSNSLQSLQSGYNRQSIF
jgi:hypothetical protein